MTVNNGGNAVTPVLAMDRDQKVSAELELTGEDQVVLEGVAPATGKYLVIGSADVQCVAVPFAASLGLKIGAETLAERAIMTGVVNNERLPLAYTWVVTLTAGQAVFLVAKNTGGGVYKINPIHTVLTLLRIG